MFAQIRCQRDRFDYLSRQDWLLKWKFKSRFAVFEVFIKFKGNDLIYLKKINRIEFDICKKEEIRKMVEVNISLHIFAVNDEYYKLCGSTLLMKAMRACNAYNFSLIKIIK